MNDMSKVSWPGWEVVRKIGSGSFGAVYEIQRDVFGDIERAALKVITIPQSRSDIEELLNEGYDEASVTERFRGYLQDIAREYSLMAKMKGHTNVVYCDDIRYVQHDDGIGWDIYIKMELLTPMMTTLGNEIPEETAIRVGKDICSALVLCKQQNIVHRDIKPQNIFVSANGEYKLGDFGIAKTAEKTTGGTKIGTYKYMAPEVYNNQPYGSASDIYSLGIVLYWLLNYRRTPFLPLPPQTPTASIEDEARRRRFSGEPIPAPANGSPRLKAIVMKACAYDPAERYASAEEMLADLESLGITQTIPVQSVAAAYAANSAEDATMGMFAQQPVRPVVAPAAPAAPVYSAPAPQDAGDATVGMFGAAQQPARPVVAPAAPAAPVYSAPAPQDAGDATVGMFGAAQQPARPVVAPAAPAAPVYSAPAPQDAGDATVGMFGAAQQPVRPVAAPAAPAAPVYSAPASQDAGDATVGMFAAKPAAAPKAAPAVSTAPVVAAAPVASAPAATKKPEPVKAESKKEVVKKPAEKADEEKKKKPVLLFAGIGAAVVALLVVVLLLVLPSGGGDVATDGNGNVVNQGENNSGAPVNPALKGDDIFNGERFPEMLWGYYESTVYDYSGSREDANEFLDGMEYFTIPTNQGDYEFAALPLSLHVGKYTHFMGSFYYEDDLYEPYTPKGRSMFRKAYIDEVGDMTEEEFKKIETLMDLDVMEIQFVDKNGSARIGMVHYKIENGKLNIYDLTVDDGYNIILSDEPLVSCDFLHDGAKLTLMTKGGVQRDYCGSGFKPDDPSLSFSGYALNEANRYSDIEGIAFYQYGQNSTPSAYVYLTDGDTAIDPVMNFDTATGEFTLSWEQKWTTYNGNTEKADDPRTITGKIVPCTGYGFYNFTVFYMFIDGQRYDYLMTDDEYSENKYSYLLDDDVAVDDLNTSQLDDINAAKRDILEELRKAFADAGITAEIDYTTGQISLESNFLFATNSADLSDDGMSYLNRFVDAYTSVIMREDYVNYISKIMVEGHTDTSGSYSLNQDLSERRAASVANQCIGRNSALASLIQTRGCSYDYPVYNDDGTVNMDKSRRVTFRFILSIGQ